MQIWPIIFALALLSLAGFAVGQWRATVVMRQNQALHSRPGHHGWYTALITFLPALLVLLAASSLIPRTIDTTILSKLPRSEQPVDPLSRQVALNEIQSLSEHSGITPSTPAMADAAMHYETRTRQATMWLAFGVLGIGLAGLIISNTQITPQFRARTVVESIFMGGLSLSSIIAILITVGIVLSLLFESLRFFEKIPLSNFLGTSWSTQMAIRSDQVGSNGSFGALPLIYGTAFISLIAMLVAVPIGLMSAIYLTQYASTRMRRILKPVLEILAGVPTVVYGVFAAITIAPFIRAWGQSMGIDATSDSALAAGLVMGVMIIPFMSSMSDDALTAVPQSMRDGSLALGATPSETIRKILLPAALPGIAGSFLLAVSRAIGETMIVVMAAGQAANLTVNPFKSVTTVTVQIVAALTGGDETFDSPRTLVAFALGLLLFIITLILNIIALRVVKKYREAYD